jgi:hypothetical protein
MFAPQQYRAKAAEYTDLVKTASNPAEALEFQALEQSFTVLADNEQWLADNHGKTVDAIIKNGSAGDETPPEEEEHVLRCLGAALIMQWSTLPRKLKRELFDNAGAMGELLDAATLRGQIARFLHKHKEGEDSRTRLPM